jgi:hypothetical protein
MILMTLLALAVTASVNAGIEDDFIADQRQQHAQIEADMARMSTLGKDLRDFQRDLIRMNLETYMTLLEMSRNSGNAVEFCRSELTWARAQWQLVK